MYKVVLDLADGTSVIYDNVTDYDVEEINGLDDEENEQEEEEQAEEEIETEED